MEYGFVFFALSYFVSDDAPQFHKLMNAYTTNH
jgi:hypothetical protein